MGIIIKGADTQPQVTFDKVFVSELKIVQHTNSNDTVTPVYEVAIEYRMYGVDVHQQRHYQNDCREILVKDFIALAMNKYSTGDQTLILALRSIETAIAALIKHDMGTDAEVI